MHNLKPKKYWGQHFLTDQGIASKIVKLLPADSADTVVEIGPGQGILTQILLPLYPNLKVVEVDPEAVTYLNSHLQMDPSQIIHEDVLKWNPSATLPKNSFWIGNLPYNISSPFFFSLFENLPYFHTGVFMIQKEVAQRICSDKGSKTYGILSVLLGAFFELNYAFSVPPGVFRPPPKVNSGVIVLKRKDILPEVEFSIFKRVVKQAFNQRRKTLRNSLKPLEFSDFEGKETMLKLRAEALSVEEFLKLTKHLI